MTFTKSIVAVAAFSSLFLAVRATDGLADGVKIYRPGQGILFDAGHKYGAGYFLQEVGRCKLVITLAADLNWDNPEGFTAIRHEETLKPGASTRYVHGGKAFRFGCGSDAATMTFESVNALAAEK